MASNIVVRLPPPARDRVVRMTNVHFAADNKVIDKFFAGYTIQDQYRTTNVRIGTRSVVYVLFSTVADKIRSLELSGSMLFDREIKIQPAPHGNYTLNDNETAFVKPVKGKGKGKNAATVAEHSNDAPAFNVSDFPVLGTPQDKDTSKSLPAAPVASSNEIETPTEPVETTLKDALGDMTMGTDEHAVSDTRSAGNEQGSERQEADSSIAAAEAENTASRSAITERKTSQTYGLAPYDTTTGPFGRKTLQTATDGHNMAKYTSQFHGLPSVPATYDNWNLNGHDAYDRSKNILTPSDWYGFQAKQIEKAEQEQEQEGTNADRIGAVPAEGEDEKTRKRGKCGGKK